MTKRTKSTCLPEMGLNIVWDDHLCKKQGRFFILKINGKKFKRNPADQMKATKIIEEKFAEADTSKWRY